MSDHATYEIERKFLIEFPDIPRLAADPTCRRAEITQTYLLSAPDEEVRVRARTEGDITLYFHTVKRKVAGAKRVEIEEAISEAAYVSALTHAAPDRRPIVKTRYCLPFEGHLLEIDIYPFWSDRAILEVELADERETFSLPDWIRVLREVTEDEAYKNGSLSRKIP